MNFQVWLNENNVFPIPRDEAVRQGFLFHGIGGDESLQELLDSPGFHGGGFSTRPINIYGPNYIAVRRQDMPEPTYELGRSAHSLGMGDLNVQYTFNEPFRDFVPIRSEDDAKYFGNQLYGAPHKYLYRADAEGNVLGPLVDSDKP